MRTAFRVFGCTLVCLLEAAAPKPFRVIEAGIHQSEDGPLAPAGTSFVPGEVIFFSCRIDGYQVSPVKKVNIQYQFSAVDPAGVPIVEPVTGKVDTELSPEDKDWKPKIRQTVLVPPLGGSGIYKIKLSVKDELSGAAAETESPFEVQGHAV